MFTGRRFDFETGLYYYRARYYSANLGRFLQTDPIGMQDQMNLYAYVGNDPVNATDPSGKFLDIIADAVFIVADIVILAHDEIANGGANRAENLAALGADVAGAVIPGATGLGLAARAAKTASKVEKTASKAQDGAKVTRYMTKGEVDEAMKTGHIPNYGKKGDPRPTHMTDEAPTNSSAQAAQRYELDPAPTHRATVPGDRVPNRSTPPDGSDTTSGGGRQFVTNDPVPVKPEEIHELDP